MLLWLAKDSLHTPVPPAAHENPDFKQFADNLRSIRQAQGLSQMDLASRCNVHHTLIARIETYTREPRVTTVARLAFGLGVPAADLMAGIPTAGLRDG